MLKVLTLDGMSMFINLLKTLITKEQIGLTNVEDKSSEDIRNELTYKNVVTALGYTPSAETSASAFSFEIVNDELILHYADGTATPNMYINSDGNLIYSM